MTTSEHPRLAAPSLGKILEAFFGVNLADIERLGSSSTAANAATPPKGSSVADIPVKIEDPAAQWEQQPATNAP